MTKRTRVVLVHADVPSGAPPPGAHPLAQALQAQGAAVRELPLCAPYDPLLDAIEDGWMPVACKAPGQPNTMS